MLRVKYPIRETVAAQELVIDFFADILFATPISEAYAGAVVGEANIVASGGTDIVGTAFNKVLPTQNYINPLQVQSYQNMIRSGQVLKPSVGYTDAAGRVFLEDGHHRFVASMLEGIQPNLIIRNTGGPVGYSNWFNTTYQLPPLGH